MGVTLGSKAMKIPKRKDTAEFKELAVKRVKEWLTPNAAPNESGFNKQTLATESRQRNFTPFAPYQARTSDFTLNGRMEPQPPFPGPFIPA